MLLVDLSVSMIGRWSSATSEECVDNSPKRLDICVNQPLDSCLIKVQSLIREQPRCRKSFHQLYLYLHCLSLPLFSNSAPTSLITFPTSSIPNIILLPTPARIPYGLRLVISSEEYANESIELDEGVSEGIWSGRNEYLGGRAGGVPVRGDSGIDASYFLFGSVLLLSSASCSPGSVKAY